MLVPTMKSVQISSTKHDRRVWTLTYSYQRTRKIMSNYDFLNFELNKCSSSLLLYVERKGEHSDKQPQVRELFDMISDKISISVLRLVCGQGETTSSKEIMSKVKISRKIFYSVISELENIGLLRVGEGNTTQPT